MKHVFSTKEIPHLWAHKTQDSARNPQGNLFFARDTIYSYRTNYPIACHITTKRGHAVLVRTNKYSVTTARHINMVSNSVPSGVTMFDVPDVEARTPDQHKANANYLLKDLEHEIGRAARANTIHHKQRKTEQAREKREHLAQYIEFFRIRFKKIPSVPDFTAEMRAKMEARAKELMTPEHQARLLYDRAKREMAADFAKRELHKTQIESWLNGIGWGYNFPGPTLLRVKGNEVETSRGASFPLSHAKRGLALIRAVMSKKEEWKRNGHTCHLGHYSLDRITPDGTVYAGCHVVPWTSIERIVSVIDGYKEVEAQ